MFGHARSAETPTSCMLHSVTHVARDFYRQPQQQSIHAHEHSQTYRRLSKYPVRPNISQGHPSCLGYQPGSNSAECARPTDRSLPPEHASHQPASCGAGGGDAPASQQQPAANRPTRRGIRELRRSQRHVSLSGPTHDLGDKNIQHLTAQLSHVQYDLKRYEETCLANFGVDWEQAIVDDHKRVANEISAVPLLLTFD